MALFTGINVVSIEVPDLEGARRFYGGVLELGEPSYDLSHLGWIEWPFPDKPTGLSVTQVGPDWRPHHNVTVVLDVDDCYRMREVLLAKGVRCDEPVQVPGVVTYCSFYDPFGNRLQMVSA